MNNIGIALVVIAIASDVATTGIATQSTLAGGPGPGGGNGGNGPPPGPNDVQRNPDASLAFKFPALIDADNSLRGTVGQLLSDPSLSDQAKAIISDRTTHQLNILDSRACPSSGPGPASCPFP